MKKHILYILLLVYPFFSFQSDSSNVLPTIYAEEKDISYRDINLNSCSNDSLREKVLYRSERCKLDVYYPTKKSNFATIIFFLGVN